MNRHHQQGTTLLEVLITALILSLGLLGLAGLQVKSLQFNHSAYQRSQATILSYEIADRIRANSITSNAASIANYNVANTANPGTVANCLNTTGCTIAEMARTDLSQWKTTLAAILPNGVGVTCFDSTPDDGTPAAVACDGGGIMMVVKVWWTDDKTATAAAGGTQTTLFTMSFRP